MDVTSSCCERGGAGAARDAPSKRPLMMASSSSGAQNRIAKLVACMRSQATPRYHTAHMRSGAAHAPNAQMMRDMQHRLSGNGAGPYRVELGVVADAALKARAAAKKN